MLFEKSTLSWLIVFLGNPGEQYENTRHNIGWLVADQVAERCHTPIQRLKFKALTATATLGGVKVLLMKPVTFMNLSGEAAGEAARFYKIPPDHVLVVSDDIDMKPGKLRLRMSGSAGGHNGHKSIAQHLGTDGYPRLKIGVGGKPHPDYDLADWVLGKFTKEDQALMTEAAKKAADTIERLLKDGPDRAMERCNR